MFNDRKVENSSYQLEVGKGPREEEGLSLDRLRSLNTREHWKGYLELRWKRGQKIKASSGLGIFKTASA
jgi:hypothetical protein